MAKIALITVAFLLTLALTSAAPAEKAPTNLKEPLHAPAEAKEDLAAGQDDLKPAASHWGGGWGYGGGFGHYGGHYPYYGSYWGYPSWGYGYGSWPYYGGYGGYGGFGNHGYWW